jgi:hypothetical protein
MVEDPAGRNFKGVAALKARGKVSGNPTLAAANRAAADARIGSLLPFCKSHDVC